LAEESIFSDELIRQLVSVGEVDILVGVPSYNNAKTIGEVVQAVQIGLLRHFPRERAALMNADGGSRDGTGEAVLAAPVQAGDGPPEIHSLRTFHRVTGRYPGDGESGGGLRMILAAADLLRAKACVVVPPDDRLEPEAVQHLVQPVYQQDFDFVVPVYRRHKYGGLLITNLVYPVSRAAYGCRIREPIPAAFAVSGRFASHCLEPDIWSQKIRPSWAEAWLTATAIAEGFRVCQAFLGTKPHLQKASSASPVEAIREAVGALFWSLERREDFWLSHEGSAAVPGWDGEPLVTAEPVRVDRKLRVQMFRTGVTELAPILSTILSAETLGAIRTLAESDGENLHFDDELWVRTVYEFSAAYHKQVMHRDHLMQALVPLYRGRIASFMAETWRASTNEVEARIESLCLAFERAKPYLVERWQGRE
jgi:glucosylglycerate synthase